jgi:hypothetical protein
VSKDPFEVDTRTELAERLEQLYPFKTYMAPVEDKNRVAVGIWLVGGPPIHGEGDSMAHALASLLDNAVKYVGEWERTLRFGAEHQKYWGWVYRLLLAGDDDHILATLLGEPVE